MMQYILFTSHSCVLNIQSPDVPRRSGIFYDNWAP